MTENSSLTSKLHSQFVHGKSTFKEFKISLIFLGKPNVQTKT